MGINSLLTKTPAEVATWLENVRTGQIKVGDGFNWLGLAQVAASKAGEELGTTDDRITWAYVAISIYDYLASVLDTSSGDTYEISAMNLRAAMINNMGAVHDHPILDPSTIGSWYLDRLEMSLDEAISAARSRHSLEQMRQLRKIKNRLNIVRYLSNKGYPFGKDVKAWIEAADYF